MSLSSNLTLLEPLDPALWRNIQGFRMNRHGPDRELCDLEVQDHMQGEVQRACEKRGWYVQSAHGEHIGYVASARNGAVLVKGESIADAILAAYVKCLQELA